MKKILLVDDQLDRFKGMRAGLAGLLSDDSDLELFTIHLGDAHQFIPGEGPRKIPFLKLPRHYDLILVHGRDKDRLLGFSGGQTVWYGGVSGPDPDQEVGDDHHSIFRSIEGSKQALTVEEARQLLSFLAAGDEPAMLRAEGRDQRHDLLRDVLDTLAAISIGSFNQNLYRQKIYDFYDLVQQHGVNPVTEPIAYVTALMGIEKGTNALAYKREINAKMAEIRNELQTLI